MGGYADVTGYYIFPLTYPHKFIASPILLNTTGSFGKTGDPPDLFEISIVLGKGRDTRSRFPRGGIELEQRWLPDGSAQVMRLTEN